MPLIIDTPFLSADFALFAIDTFISSRASCRRYARAAAARQLSAFAR